MRFYLSLLSESALVNLSNNSFKVQPNRSLKSLEASLLTESLRSTPIHQNRRRAICDELEVVLRRWNGRLSVKDISMYSYGYDTHQAPMELALVDADNATPTKSPIYNHRSVAEALRKAGYAGRFHNPNAARLCALQNRPPGTYNPTAPWSQLSQRRLSDELHYPIQLRITLTPSGKSPFTLMMPDPYVIPRYDLLSLVYHKIGDKELLALVWAWMRTQRLSQFSTIAVAIMTEMFLRTRSKGSIDEKLIGFFRFWSSSSWTRTQIVSLNATDSQRPVPYLTKSQRSHLLRELSAELQPSSLGLQPLIVRDPFVLTKNHAEGVSSSELERFREKCRSAVRLLLEGSFFSSTFNIPLSRIPSPSLPPTLHGKHDIDDLFTARLVGLPPEVPRRRSKTLKLVQDTIQKRYGNHYKVELFGSVRYGVSVPESDLDLVIIDPEGNDAFKTGARKKRLPAIYNIWRLGSVLREAGFEDVQCISRAAVPIGNPTRTRSHRRFALTCSPSHLSVKFRDPRTGIHCDINVNERLGLLNSNLLEAYCKAFPLLRPMLMAIKLWAKPLGLNNPSPTKPKEIQSFSSYALALMTVSFLQTRGLLPNLQGNLPPLKPNVEGSVFVIRIKQIQVRCDVRFHHKISGWRPLTTGQKLSEVLRDWFSYWCHEFQYAEQAISIRHGGLGATPASSPPPAICVLDPFIGEKNVAKAVKAEVLQRFIGECRAVLDASKDDTDLMELLFSKK
ncbi:hypothetical protein D9615_005496 [Tricholomella constricta]|uniref:Poly(A) RNA polymerase mitochondrial-like central palm domain-containing protein n=1 Tax=Tricholomella constricta TaxID=117010 RepID=A0A8H5M5N0_9AGAR|nr:hypothetical protein D9615_005496 [Tricholomella constricta]